jgi:hypothetical protein
MAKVTFRFARTHGYTYLVPAQQRELATFKGIDQSDPAAQRPFDIINGEHVPRAPKPDSVRYFQNAWQEIAVYTSEDGRYELSVRLTPDEIDNAPKEIEADVAI